MIKNINFRLNILSISSLTYCYWPQHMGSGSAKRSPRALYQSGDIAIRWIRSLMGLRLESDDIETTL